MRNVHVLSLATVLFAPALALAEPKLELPGLALTMRAPEGSQATDHGGKVMLKLGDDRLLVYASTGKTLAETKAALTSTGKVKRTVVDDKDGLVAEMAGGKTAFVVIVAKTIAGKSYRCENNLHTAVGTEPKARALLDACRSLAARP